MMKSPLVLTPLGGMPIFQPGDNLVLEILKAASNQGIQILEDDIFVLAQKIISKSEGRFVNLVDVKPGRKAIKIAQKVKKDPRLVEMILSESSGILRIRPGTIIVEHRLGFVCANAGIDHSNVQPLSGNSGNWILLLPRDPDLSAKNIVDEMKLKTGKRVGVVIIDSHGRAWRNGIVGTSIGVAGVPAVVDMRGKPDLFGFNLRITQIGAVDELAAAASLVMGQAAEGIPVVHVRGFPYPLRETSSKELHRIRRKDLFR